MAVDVGEEMHATIPDSGCRIGNDHRKRFAQAQRRRAPLGHRLDDALFRPLGFVGEDDIDAMDKMVEKYKEGCGIVCGVRASRATDTFLKRTTARGYYGLMKLFGSDLIYDHADYRLMDTAALEALSHYHGDDLFLRGLVNRLGAKVGTVSYDRRAREAGESKYTLKKMLKLALKGMECGRRKPERTSRSDDAVIAEVLHA